MIKTNNQFGIMALHYTREKDKPKPPEPEITSHYWSPEEKAHYEKMKPPDNGNKYKTTAYQRPVPAPKREIDIWEERE